MTIVVTDSCEGCRFTECVDVCPVACFHADDRMVYIDSRVCIDCMACIAACPVQAIYPDADLPPEKQHWVEINAERSLELPAILKKSEPLPTAVEKRAALGF